MAAWVGLDVWFFIASPKGGVEMWIVPGIHCDVSDVCHSGPLHGACLVLRW